MRFARRIITLLLVPALAPACCEPRFKIGPFRDG